MEEQYGEKMPKDMKKEIKKMFDMVDSDGSGEIDKAEFEAAIAAHGALGQKTKMSFHKLVQMKSKARQGAPSWEDVLEVLDADASGTVSWDEIVAFIKQIEKEHDIKISKKDKKAIKAAFEQVDADGSGDIDKAEFEAAVAAMEGLAQLKKYMWVLSPHNSKIDGLKIFQTVSKFWINRIPKIYKIKAFLFDYLKFLISQSIYYRL